MKPLPNTLERDLRKRAEELSEQIAESTASQMRTNDLVKKLEELRRRSEATATAPEKSQGLSARLR